MNPPWISACRPGIVVGEPLAERADRYRGCLRRKNGAGTAGRRGARRLSGRRLRGPGRRRAICRLGWPASPSAPSTPPSSPATRPSAASQRLRAFWERVSSRLLAWPARRRRQFAPRVQRDERRAAPPSAACPASSSRASRRAAFMPPGTPRGDQLLRHLSAARPRSMELVDFDLLNSGDGALERRRGAVAHRQHAIFRHRRAARRPGAHHGERRAAAGLPADRDRRRALLGRRPRLQHAARNTCSSDGRASDI